MGTEKNIDKSKNRFSSRKSIVNEGRLREMNTFGGSPIPHSDYLLMLEDLLSMSIRRQGRPLPMIKLQGEILTDLISTEGSVADYKKKILELESEKASEDDLNYVKSELYKYKRVKYALRDIGDGIAWRHLAFDRCVLSELGNYPRKQHINNDGGTTQELHELGEVINKNNEVAILNDITNILKKGDITAKLANGEFEFIEVKSSNAKGSRMSRQKNALEETVMFLNEGEKEKDGKILKIKNLPLAPQSYMTTFERFLKRAERECMVIDKIGEHLLIHVVDYQAASEDVDAESFFTKYENTRRQWYEKGELFLEFSSVDRFSFVKNFVPFSVFPIEHKFRVKLMSGATIVNSILNISAVIRYLNKRGWILVKSPADFQKEAEANNDEEINEIAAFRKGPLTMTLALPVLARLAHEYLSIVTLGDIFDAIYKAGRTSAHGIFPNLEDESLQWD